MKFAQQVNLTVNTNRLQAASRALVACDASLKDQNQTFEFAGASFGGPDAIFIKRGLMDALGQIADDARSALRAGGVEFDDDPKPPADPAKNKPSRVSKKTKR